MAISIDFRTFFDRICESGIFTQERLQAFFSCLPEDQRVEDVDTFGKALVEAGELTPYQLGRILNGRQHGLVLGKNVLLSRIGEGGMGCVYKAEHTTMKRIVAVKVMNEKALSSVRIRRRFLMEVQTAAKLIHPNIVTAYDAGEQDNVPYLVMEYVDGDTLRSIVDDNGPLEFSTAIGYMLQIAEGLKYAHSKGVIHRDIKPTNLLLDKKGMAKILDMGLAMIIHNDDKTITDSALMELTKDRHVVGTVDYMSPEQTGDQNQIDHRADIYSLGCSLFYLVTGRRPFRRSTPIKTLVAHQTDPIPSMRTANPNIPVDADRLLARMVAKHPDDRFQSADELIDGLTEFLNRAQTDFRDTNDVEHEEEPGEGFSLLDDAEDDELQAAAASRIEINLENLTEHAVGIDLGTTFSAVSYLDNHGKPTTLPNAEGDKITPSVLFFDDGDVIVGKESVKAMATDMPMIAECAKRELGAAKFHKKLGKHKYPPEVLLAYILRKLKRDAEEQIGPIRRAVITVPAYFDETRRKATQDAGYLAGLDVMDIINEPTAAAIAYGYHQVALRDQSAESRQFADRPQRILVYDLGGGTFDITVMEIRSNVYRTIATDGDVRLGGRDWDERLVDYIADKFFEQTGEDPRLEANSMGRLLRECEDAKRTLSTRQKATIAVEYEGKALRVAITREFLEGLTLDLLARTEFTTRQTLKEAKLTWQKINRILMVGGSTRMPAVARMLHEISGIKPDRSVAPDEAVAHGAAIRAGMLLLAQKGKPMPIKIMNVNSHSLGVVGANPTTGQLQAALLIPRNTPLPASAERVFRTTKDSQSSILVQIVEGESVVPHECSLVGKCIVHNLPRNLPARTPITVCFQYNEDGRLTVLVKVTGIELKQQIMRENSMSQSKMDRWRDKLAEQSD